MAHSADLEVLPIPVHFGRQVVQVLQGLLDVACRRFCEVVMYAPCVRAVLLQEREVVMPRPYLKNCDGYSTTERTEAVGALVEHERLPMQPSILPRYWDSEGQVVGGV